MSLSSPASNSRELAFHSFSGVAPCAGTSQFVELYDVHGKFSVFVEAIKLPSPWVSFRVRSELSHFTPKSLSKLTTRLPRRPTFLSGTPKLGVNDCVIEVPFGKNLRFTIVSCVCHQRGCAYLRAWVQLHRWVNYQRRMSRLPLVWSSFVIVHESLSYQSLHAKSTIYLPLRPAGNQLSTYIPPKDVPNEMNFRFRKANVNHISSTTQLTSLYPAIAVPVHIRSKKGPRRPLQPRTFSSGQSALPLGISRATRVGKRAVPWSTHMNTSFSNPST